MRYQVRLGIKDVELWQKQEGWAQWMKMNPHEICPDLPPLLIQPWTQEKNIAEREKYNERERKRKDGPTPPVQRGRPHPFQNKHLPINGYSAELLNSHLAWLDDIPVERDGDENSGEDTSSGEETKEKEQEPGEGMETEGGGGVETPGSLHSGGLTKEATERGSGAALTSEA